MTIDTKEFWKLASHWRKAYTEGPAERNKAAANDLEDFFIAQLARQGQEARVAALEEAAELFDANPHAEQFNSNIAEQIRAIATSAECQACDGHGCTHYPDGEWEAKCTACKGTGIDRRATQAAPTPTQQEHVMPPFAAPAGFDKDAWVEEISEVAELYGRLLAEKQRVHAEKGRDRGAEYYIADGIRWAIGELERRCRAQGGHGDSDATQNSLPVSEQDEQALLANAVNAAYPVPDSPHTSVLQRAADDRTAYVRGWQDHARLNQGAHAGSILAGDEIEHVRTAKRAMVDALISSGLSYGKCGVISHRLEKLIADLATNAPLKGTPAAQPEKPFAGPGDWFSIDILGNPMREYAPDKWETCVWPSAAQGRGVQKCECVYATSANTESVSKGYELGGYLKKQCSYCAASPAPSAAPLPDTKLAFSNWAYLTFTANVRTKDDGKFADWTTAKMFEAWKEGARQGAAPSQVAQTGIGKCQICVCGQPESPNTVHRTDGPCYWREESEAAQVAQGEPVAWTPSGPFDANELERMAKAHPDECFLKGTGVLKLIGAIRTLEQAAAPVAPPQPDKRIFDALNTTLWLYRRLPGCYGKPPFVDAAIMTFADVLGLEAPLAIQERHKLHHASAQEGEKA